jgi:hypothetical protein
MTDFAIFALFKEASTGRGAKSGIATETNDETFYRDI